MSVQEKARNSAEQFLRYMIPENKKSLNDGTGTTEHYAFGRTKVYFDSYVQELLQQKRSAIVNKYATLIQKIVRGHLCRLKHLTGEKLKAKKAEDEARQRKEITYAQICITKVKRNRR
jgi:myosin heavy subunit